MLWDFLSVKSIEEQCSGQILGQTGENFLPGKLGSGDPGQSGGKALFSISKALPSPASGAIIPRRTGCRMTWC